MGIFSQKATQRSNVAVDFLTSFIGPMASGYFQQQQAEAANAATGELQNRALGEAGTLDSTIQGMVRRLGQRGNAGMDAMVQRILFGTNPTGSLEDVQRILMNGGSQAEAEAAFNGPGDPGGGFAGRMAMAEAESADAEATGLDGYRRLMEGVLGEMEGMGEASRAEIMRTYRGEEQRAAADLGRRGFSMSTLLPAVRLGVGRQRDAAVGALDEQLRRERAGVQKEIGQNALTFLNNSRSNRLNRLLDTSGDFLSALDTLQSRRFQFGQNNDAALIDAVQRGGDTRLGIIQAPYAIPSGPPPTNWGDVFSAGFNNWSALRASRQQPQTDYTPGLIGAGGNLASAATLGWMLG